MIYSYKNNMISFLYLMLYWICLVTLIDLIFIYLIKSELDKEALPNWINDGPPKEVTIDDESKTDVKMNLNSESSQKLGIEKNLNFS